jgi:hypothetical protein
MKKKCVKCKNKNGSKMNVNEQEVYDGVEEMLADVVFVVDN